MVSVKPGDSAPAFELKDDAGRVWTKEDLLGSTTVLYFYPRDDTPGCTKEACSFQDRLDPLSKAGAQVLGVSDDDAESHRAFKEKHGLTFPLLVDTGADLAKAYGVWVEKQMFGNTFMGIQRATFLIDETGTIAKVWPKVDPEGHGDEVLEAIGDL